MEGLYGGNGPSRAVRSGLSSMLAVSFGKGTARLSQAFHLLACLPACLPVNEEVYSWRRHTRERGREEVRVG